MPLARSTGSVFFLGVLLAGFTVAAFARSCANEFVNFDDSTYVTLNTHVQPGLTAASVEWAFSIQSSNWHPLTWLSLEMDASLWGLNPFGYHLSNVVLHAVNTWLLFWLLVELTGASWPSLFASALFGLHPLHVESVAWVAERKDVLSALFLLLTIWSYLRYVRQGSAVHYLLMMSAFVSGLMAKSMLVTLPFVLLLLDWWPLGRWPSTGNRRGVEILPSAPSQSLIVEKVPLIGLAAAAGVMTLLAQHQGGSINPLDRLPFSVRAENAIVAYVRYVGKTIWPVDLSIYYPLQHALLPSAQVMASVALLAALTGIFWVLRRRRPYCIVGWLWFLVTLVPVIGLVQVGDQALADRYTYIPAIGLFILASWGLSDLVSWSGLPLPLAGATLCLILIVCAWQTSVQLGVWHDSVRLWQHAASVSPDSYMAWNNLGQAVEQQAKVESARLEKAGRYQEATSISQEALERAMNDYAAALSLKPDLWIAHYNWGVALVQLGRRDEAAAHFLKALEIDPEFSQAHYNLGLVQAAQGNQEQAARSFAEALRCNPTFLAARMQLGKSLTKQGKFNEAVTKFSQACQQDPLNAEAQANLAMALSLAGRWNEAVGCYRQAHNLQPKVADYAYSLAYALKQSSQAALAAPLYSQAIDLDPYWPDRTNHHAWELATSCQSAARFGPLAIRLAKELCSLPTGPKPEYLDTLAAAHAEIGDFDEAETCAKQSLDLASRLGYPSAFAEQVKQRLQLYAGHRAYHEAANSRSSP
jgi:tetratricopeptide (TPR) repeat protein